MKIYRNFWQILLYICYNYIKKTDLKGGDDMINGRRTVGLFLGGVTGNLQRRFCKALYNSSKEYGYDKLIRFYNRTADSRTFFGNQFKQVYGKPLRKVWNDWKVDEKEHQAENLVLQAREDLLKRADGRKILDNLKQYPMGRFSMQRDGSIPEEKPPFVSE